jgi:hypothetical protein
MTVAAVRTAPARSSMSINAMLETTPSKGAPSHQSVVVASALTYVTPAASRA